ncbi:unnamed protein product, partial [Didymodactylos carnosus]
FLPTIERILKEWSEKSIQGGFHTFPIVSESQEKEAYKWVQNLDKNSLLHWNGHSHIVSSSFQKHYNP